MIQQIRLVVLIPQAVMKWSKIPEKGDRERKVQFIRFAHFLLLPFTGMLGASSHWQGQYKPMTGSSFRAAFSCYEAPQNNKPGLNTSFVLLLYISDFQSVDLVKRKKSRKLVHSESRETRTFRLSCPLSWRYQMSPQDDSLCWMVLDSWSQKERIYFRDQRRGFRHSEFHVAKVLLQWKMG